MEIKQTWERKTWKLNKNEKEQTEIKQKWERHNSHMRRTDREHMRRRGANTTPAMIKSNARRKERGTISKARHDMTRRGEKIECVRGAPVEVLDDMLYMYIYIYVYIYICLILDACLPRSVACTPSVCIAPCAVSCYLLDQSTWFPCCLFVVYNLDGCL